MNTPTWHLEYAKIVLDKWYREMGLFLDLAESWSRFPFQKKSVAECTRNALKCKTLGLIYHDKYKLLLDDK